MDKFSLLETISKYNPTISLANALKMADEICEPEKTITQRATEWAEESFTWNDRSNRKIGMIKEIRQRFDLGLKDSKDIVESMTPRAQYNFFN
jgi:ribosomal protein L7/L12